MQTREALAAAPRVFDAYRNAPLFLGRHGCRARACVKVSLHLTITRYAARKFLLLANFVAKKSCCFLQKISATIILLLEKIENKQAS